MQTFEKVFPGMLNESTEFFNSETGVKFIQNGNVKSFCDLPFTTIEMLKEAISAEPLTKSILNDWFPNQKMKQLEKFISCRFGGLDFVADIENGNLQNGEYWKCPLSGNCKAEGIVCNSPIIDGKSYTTAEIKIIQLSTTEMTNDSIAASLAMPLGSFHKIKQIVYEKIGALTKQSVTQFAYQHNLI